MKVLLLNCVYRRGSTGKIVASIADSLRAQGHTVFTCYGLGDEHIDEHSKKVCTKIEHNINSLLSRITGIPYGGLFISNYRIKRVIKEFKPDVVHVHCVNASTMNVYALLAYLAKLGIKTVLTLHAEIFHTAGCEHAFECEKWKAGCHDCNLYKQRVNSWFFDRSKESYKRMYKAVNAFASDNLIVTAVSPWLAKRARQSTIIKRYPVEYVPNGVDTSVFHYKGNAGLINRGDCKKVVLFVAPYFGLEETDIKGGRYLPKIAAALPDYKFIVVANRISGSVSVGLLPENVQLWGQAKTQSELAQLYSEVDITLLLSKRETFSMVTAESLCCGTPVVGFKAGGPESIALKDFSEFVDYGDINGIIAHIADIADYDARSISESAIEEYSQSTMANLFYNLYQSSKGIFSV